MTLRDLLGALKNPDHASEFNVLDREVEFCTANRLGLELLSVYEDDGGKIIIDIGIDGE